MSKLKQYATILAANMAMAAMNKGNLYDENGGLNSPKLFCKDCIHCPNGNKTFCKYAKHSINKRTSANNCKYFENETDRETN